MVNEQSDAEIERDISMFKGLMNEAYTKIKWSYGLIGMGIVLAIIGWVNYGSGSWLGIFALVGVVLGLIGLTGYFSERKNFERYEAALNTCETVLRDRRSRGRG